MSFVICLWAPPQFTSFLLRFLHWFHCFTYKASVFLILDCMIIISFWSELRRFDLRKMMMNLMSNFVTSSCDGRCALRSLLPNRGLMASKLLLHMKRSSLTAFRRSRNRVFCELEVIYWVSIVCFVLCKCSAYFESTIILFSGSS